MGNSGKQNRQFPTEVPNHPEVIPFRMFSVIFLCFTHIADFKLFTFSFSQYMSLTEIARFVLLLPQCKVVLTYIYKVLLDPRLGVTLGAP